MDELTLDDWQLIHDLLPAVALSGNAQQLGPVIARIGEVQGKVAAIIAAEAQSDNGTASFEELQAVVAE